MSLVAKAHARVPATTSNLGPGFDCLGLALGLYNELTLELHSEIGPAVVEISGEGEKTLPRGPDNIMVKAARLVLTERVPGRLVFKAVNRIPLARGLGSSAAAVVAGLFAANRLLKPSPLDEEHLFQYAAVLEGHPDNAAPAVSGGLVAIIKEGHRLLRRPLKAHRGLCAVVCVPDFELSTAAARSVLPPTLLRNDAVENVSRALLLASALERGRWEDLDAAMRDRLHEPYRAPLVKGLQAVLAAARGAGLCGAALSGAGPSVVALCRRGPQAERIGRAMEKAFAEKGVSSRSLVLPVDRRGVTVR